MNTTTNSTTTSYRGITRYTYETTTFQGWRLSICRKWQLFTKYFSDRQYGSKEASLKAALDLRERIFAAPDKNPDDPESVFASFRTGTPVQEGGAR